MNHKPKLIITGGCSYSQVPNRDITWPVHLVNALDPDQYVYMGHGAAGNDTISRKIISTVQEALDRGFDTQDILVGIAWSGCDRTSRYSENETVYNKATHLGSDERVDSDFIVTRTQETDPFIRRGGLDLSIENSDPATKYESAGHNLRGAMTPYAIRHKTRGYFYLLNPNWEDEATIEHFKHYVSPVQAIMQTCEHILRIQWFLKSLNIKYFMTEYDCDVFTYAGPHKKEFGWKNSHYMNDQYTGDADDPDNHYNVDDCMVPLNNDQLKKLINTVYDNPEVNYLYNMINKDQWLPIRHIKHWTTENSVHPLRDPSDSHPSTGQHKDFTEQVILPYLLEKYHMQ